MSVILLTEVVRKSLEKVPNRFQLVVLAAERCRQLLDGARATLENPQRERWVKLAAREIAAGHVVRETDRWRVDRPAGAEIFTPAPEARVGDEEIFHFRDDEEEE